MPPPAVPSKVVHEFEVEDPDPRDMSPKDKSVLVAIAANPITRLDKRTGQFSRGDVVNAFTNAFEMIGGQSRLAHWADANPTEFYRLYSKLLPSSTQVDLTGEQTITVKHVLPRPHDYKHDIAGESPGAAGEDQIVDA